ncbi:acetyltransferase [Grosmannia clavigera kw1407]|uniref:Acetyltransferase n=1 Tax=Grosmannia clavigera (strain kw1407 / UAMH 11150) TaxID=655863 RepID=F0X9E6_GROCL|nr:acetyltransferase [Grosmannia clavigera kw1407]EFX06094.1 acetyltransferase [Grosmannia clavigera kw1407]
MSDSRPVLRLKRCVLRPFRASDAGPMREAADDPMVIRYMRDRFPHPYTEADAFGWLRMARAEGMPEWKEGDPGPMLRPSTCLDLAICLPDDTCIGSICVQSLGDDGTERLTREFGYWIGQKYWGRGITSEAAYALSRWALSPAGSILVPTGENLERLDAWVCGSNKASARVLERCGFVREGVRRSATIKNGTLDDIIVYGLVQSDIKAL